MGLTKKCPYCAENIKYKAVVCKHCGKDLPKKKGIIESMKEEEKKRMESMSESEKQTHLADKKHNSTIVTLWFVVLLSALFSASAIGYWALSIPILGIWLHPKHNEGLFKNRFKHFKKEKVRSVLSAILLVVMLVGLGSQLVNYIQGQIRQAQRAEEQRIIDEHQIKITILSSQEHQGDNLIYLLELDAENAETVEVNDNIIEAKDGHYSTKITLEDISTRIRIKAENEDDKEIEFIDVERNETPEEGLIRLEKEAAIAVKKAEREAELAKIEADYEATLAAQKAEWEATEAGQICTRHPYWDKNDCEKIANNRVWLGMSYDMLVEERGKPTSATPSDYGYGTQWQWCWYYHTPMCFYDDDDDGKVDSYN